MVPRIGAGPPMGFPPHTCLALAERNTAPVGASALHRPVESLVLGGPRLLLALQTSYTEPAGSRNVTPGRQWKSKPPRVGDSMRVLPTRAIKRGRAAAEAARQFFICLCLLVTHVNMVSSWLPLALAAAAAANPTPNGVISLQQVEGPRIARNGPQAVANAIAKYGGVVPPSLVVAAAASATATGVATASPESNDRSYLVPVKVGSQTLNLDFDTGSSDLWVFSSEQPKAQTQGHSVYQCNGQKVSGATWKIQYGDGSSASGNVVTAPVTVGGLTVASQEVECAKTVSSSFQQDKANDGLLGLAFDQINTVKPTKAKTWFTNILASLAKPVMTVQLKFKAPGTYTFGAIPATSFKGKIHYTKVNDAPNGFWQFPVSGYSVGNGTKQASSIQGIADTGTSVIIMNSAINKAYYAQVPKSQLNSQVGGYIFPCSTTLPDFSVYIAGSKRTVPGQYLNYAQVGSISGTEYCFGGLQPSNLPFNILGDVFLVSQTVVFDRSVPRIGFANPA